MAMREDKSELRARIFLLEREKENLDLKVATLHSQHQAHLATIQHLQAQLQDNDNDVIIILSIALLTSNTLQPTYSFLPPHKKI